MPLAETCEMVCCKKKKYKYSVIWKLYTYIYSEPTTTIIRFAHHHTYYTTTSTESSKQCQSAIY